MPSPPVFCPVQCLSLKIKQAPNPQSLLQAGKWAWANDTLRSGRVLEERMHALSSVGWQRWTERTHSDGPGFIVV